MIKRYSIQHNFGSFQNQVERYIMNLKTKSIMVFKNQINKKKILQDNHDLTNTKDVKDAKYTNKLNEIKDFILDTEDFLYYYYIRFPEYFSKIFFLISSNIEAITILDDIDKNSNCKTKLDKNIMKVNTKLTEINNKLTNKELSRLYIAHELGHIINENWMKTVNTYINNNDKLNSKEKELIYNGFSLLDEVTTQNRAEDIAYFYANKEKPKINNNLKIENNSNSYNELQQTIIYFAKTLENINPINDNNAIMTRISNIALNSNFANNIINEYKKNNQIANLHKQLYYLGFANKISNSNLINYSLEKDFKLCTEKFYKHAKEIMNYKKDTIYQR